MVNDYMVEDWKDTSGSGSQQTTRQGKVNKAKNSHKTKAKGSNGLGIKGSKNLKGCGVFEPQFQESARLFGTRRERW